jgi:hypothetical protein
MLADCGLVGRILLRRRAPVPLMEALTTRTQSADSVTIVTPMEIDSRCPKWVLVVQKRFGGCIDAPSATSRCVVILSVFGRFLSGDTSDQDSTALGRVCNSRRTHFGSDYALIAAISGLVPMMFMTRVIL